MIKAFWILLIAWVLFVPLLVVRYQLKTEGILVLTVALLLLLALV